MKTYLDLLDHVLHHGTRKEDRTGTGTLSVFGWQMRFPLEQGFPLLTTKKLHTRSIIHELLWFLQGDTNIGYLRDNGVTIWDEWADELGNLGPIYGAQWRSWPTPDGQSIDQISRIIDDIRRTPDSRRLIVSAWNVGALPDMALPPCHALFQFYVADGRLSCQLYQRSGLQPGEFIWTGGDCHLYLNHLEQARLQLSRTPRALPTLRITRQPDSIFDYRFEDFVIEGYDPWPGIKAPIAV